jgi:hypothetical protein
MENPPLHSSDEVRTFWVGPPLSIYEILSLKSFLSVGARVILYSYEKGLVVPEGVELRDANEVLPVGILERYNAGNTKAWARHSDLFRYVMLEKFGGWYADLDIVCLADALPRGEMYFGRANEARIFAGLLKFLKGAAVLKELVAEAEQLLPQAEGMSEDAARAMIGTPLLSRILQQHGLDRLAAPARDAYEIAFNEALAFFDPAQCEILRARLESCTFTHLWNGAWTALRIPNADLARLVFPNRR